MYTKSAFFRFDNMIYKQVDGISMSSPSGPLMTYIFVGFQEKQLFDKILKPYCYIRYVDNTFASFISHNEVNKLFQHLNKFCPSL